jgi:hypothetical protein
MVFLSGLSVSLVEGPVHVNILIIVGLSRNRPALATRGDPRLILLFRSYPLITGHFYTGLHSINKIALHAVDV